MTKSQFILAYEQKLRAKCDWAADAARLARFMDEVRKTLTSTGVATWSWNAPIADAAWREIGGTGKIRLRNLRALPD